MDEYRKSTQELFDYIARSPSRFHAVANLAALLCRNGFSELSAAKPWQLCAGGKYYVAQNGSALLAFILPAQPMVGAHIVAAHSDSPCFQIKENPEIACESAYTTLNVEGYGGMLCAPWFDRPLSIAGRVIVEQDGKLAPQLVNFDRDLVSIVNLAIHMDRDANKGKEYKIQRDMLPLFSGEVGGTTLRSLVAQQLKIAQDSIVDAELFLYNRMAGSIWGAQEEFISAPRLDDLQCAYTAVQALLAAQSTNKLCMAAVLDNEEVGSGTKQGALSTFLADTLRRICLATGKSEEQHLMLLAQSSMLSADGGHALHPNYPEKCDKTNRPHLGGGVLLKYAANQKYTTDAASGAALRRVLTRANVPYQVFVNHSDVPGGSTLGNLSATHVSVPTVDIGAAILAMHSPYETGSVRDTLQLTQAMSAYFETDLL